MDYNIIKNIVWLPTVAQIKVAPLFNFFVDELLDYKKEGKVKCKEEQFVVIKHTETMKVIQLKSLFAVEKLEINRYIYIKIIKLNKRIRIESKIQFLFLYSSISILLICSGVSLHPLFNQFLIIEFNPPIKKVIW